MVLLDEKSDSPILITANEAAKALSISTRKLWSMTVSGEIAHLKIGRSVRYPKTDLLNWIEENKQGGTRHGKD